MSTERLEEQIKTRVPAEVKQELQRIARERHLELSDIAREAFRNYLARVAPAVNGKPKTEPQLNLID